MTFRDLVVISTGNLRRMKLRTFLTTSGILIAVTAFVALLSFGAGSQQKIEDEFNNLGLFWTMQVYSHSRGAPTDTGRQPELDVAAIERIAAVPGVTLVYPYDAFTVQVTLGDSARPSKAQALPAEALRTRLFSKMAAGEPIHADTSREAMITRQLAEELGFPVPDSALGRTLVVATKVSTLDSALAHVVLDRGESIVDRLKKIHPDSLLHARYRSRVLRTEANEAVRRFTAGFIGAQETVAETLMIAGVRENPMGNARRGDHVVIPLASARRFATRGPGNGPTELFAAMSRGTLFGDQGGNGKTFPQLTLTFDPKVPYRQVRDSIQTMGYRVFSFAEQFEQMQQFFLYFDLALGVIGMIALLTASLGIVNTMVMSITERRKEIGILKSLGADEPDIRRLFLVESGVIGAIGTGAGILLGWIVTRIASLAAQAYMKNQGMPEMDLFALPPWLLLIAVSVGVGVSVLAGWYPAARAASVDPVEALRSE